MTTQQIILSLVTTNLLVWTVVLSVWNYRVYQYHKKVKAEYNNLCVKRNEMFHTLNKFRAQSYQALKCLKVCYAEVKTKFTLEERTRISMDFLYRAEKNLEVLKKMSGK